jgi:cytochrome b6-f complex iron-sulfur subunit
MNNDSPLEKGASRRQFLQTASITGGALILGRAALAAPGDEAAVDATTDTVIKLDEHAALQKVGGFEIFEIGTDRVIVAHTEAGFTACSAVCPHKGCDVEYRLADKQFYCPCHRSRFDESGKVLQGPAKTDLAQYDAAQALVVKGK